MKKWRKIRTATGAVAVLLFIFSLALPVACAISASINPPKVTIKAEYLQDVERSIQVENSGGKEITVSLMGDVKGVELEFGANDFALSPGGSKDVPIVFKITQQGYFGGEIAVKISEVGAGEGRIAPSIRFPCAVAIDATDAVTPASTPSSSPTPFHTTEGKEAIFGSLIYVVIVIVIVIAIVSLGLYAKFGRRR